MSRHALVRSRRQFLEACALLAAAGCAPLAANTRLAQDVLGEPERRAWRDVLRSLTAAILAFDDLRFPVKPEEVEREVFAHFDLDDPDRYEGVRKGLVIFDDTALFGARLAPLVDDERTNYAASDADVDQAVKHDAALLAGEPSVTGRFVELPLEAQRRYVRLWARSAFTQRRRFYGGAKAILMISAYSMRPMWRVIGYDGPLLGG
jgi:hypothetical protein